MTQKQHTYADLAVSLVFLSSSLYFLLNMDAYIDQGLPAVIDPLIFPKFIVIIVQTFSVLFMAGALRSLIRIGRADPDAPAVVYTDADQDEPEERGRGFYLYIAILLVYYVSFDSIGFLLCTPPVMLAIAWLLGNRRLLVPFLSFTAFAIVLDQLFFRAMKLALPAGIFPSGIFPF